jgi:hypothetical protein
VFESKENLKENSTEKLKIFSNFLNHFAEITVYFGLIEKFKINYKITSGKHLFCEPPTIKWIFLTLCGEKFL